MLSNIGPEARQGLSVEPVATPCDWPGGEASIPFDQHQRYGIAARAIERIRRNDKPLAILELGANTHKLLGRFLPSDKVVYMDSEMPVEMVDDPDVFVGDATEVSLPDKSFDVVVALDVLEHISPGRRRAFLRHAARLARVLTIIGSPFKASSVVAAEKEAGDFWQSLFDRPYRWLAEHAANGLPDLEWAVSALNELGYECRSFRHGDLALWTSLMRCHFAKEFVTALKPFVLDLDRYYQEAVFDADYAPSSGYRSFLFCSAHPEVLAFFEQPLCETLGGLADNPGFKLFKSISGRLSALATEHAAGQKNLADLYDRIESLNLSAAECERRIAALNQDASEREERIALLKQAAIERDGEIVRLEKAFSDREEQLARIINSRCWKATEPIRLLSRTIRTGLSFYGRIVRNSAFLRTEAYRAFRDPRWAIHMGKSALGILGTKGWHGLKQEILYRKQGIETFSHDYHEWISRYDSMTNRRRREIECLIQGFSKKPLISVVMPVFNTVPEYLDAAIHSVQRQIYPYWELCIADDASTDPAVRRVLEHHRNRDARVKVAFRPDNGHISRASNSALELVEGDFVALLDHDDTLPEHALFWVARAIDKHPNVQLIYSDEDKIDEKGKRYDPYFKCEFNYELFLAQNMVSHLGVYKASLLREIGGFRPGFEGSQDWDVVLRALEKLSPDQILHIPRVLYHWRAITGSTALAPNEKNYAAEAGRKAVQEHLDRRGLGGRVVLAPGNTMFNRVIFPRPHPEPLVSIIIPTRDRAELLDVCVNSILKLSTYNNYEITIVDNGSRETATFELFRRLPAEKVRVLRDESPFSFSALNNYGVSESRGDLLCFMNNDIEILTPDWLEEMASFAVRPDVGAVGARLWYPDGHLQHGGVILGIGGVASHSHYNCPRGRSGYFGRAVLHQSFSAVTAACLLIRRSIYEEVGGMDESLAVAFNDVDFCLRVRQEGYRNVWTPYAEMLHHESASRGRDDTREKQDRFAAEIRLMKLRWGRQLLKDPAYSPNLTLDREDFTLSWPPRFEKDIVSVF